jgi:hypothetical protein
MTTYLGNAFSLNMLDIAPQGLIAEIKPVAPADIPQDVVSIIGHEDVAVILAGLLGWRVEVNRGTFILLPDDILYVAQYRGPRLPAGATTLPSDAKVEFYRVTFRMMERKN